MLKYISYLNLFLGIIFIAILESNKNYLDLALIIPSVFFNWVTLFHFIKNSLKFEKWHLYLGFLAVFFSVASMLIIFQVFFETNIPNEIIYFNVIRLIFEILVILQFITAFKANKHLQIK